jgi:tetratricopeptide (TPR) repeat protein
MSPIIKQFDTLTREQILALRPGVWGDLELLDVMEHFEKERKDRDREMAVAELALRSPQVSEVDYYLLYLNLVGYYRWKRNFPAALRWAHALIAHDEQHNEGRNRANHCRDLAETYLAAGDPSAGSGQSLDTGLALFARLAQADPTDIWNYNALGFSLPRAGLPHLALEVLDYALALVARKDPEQLKEQLTDQRRRAAETSASTSDRTGDLSPAVLAEFRAAVLPPRPARPARSAKRKEATPYLPPVAQLLTADPSGDTAFEAEILARGRVLVPELVRLAFDLELPPDGAPARAVALLRALRDAQAAELGELSAWLDRASGDWRNELLARRCGKVGGYTTPELEAIAADTQYSVYIRASATEALVERAERSPAQRERVVAFMRMLLTRLEADTAGEETFVGFLIGDILDLDARELYPEIRRVFAEDRVDASIIDLLFVHHRWGLAPLPIPERRGDGLYLRLRCTACDRVREHFVQNVLLDLGTLEQQTQGRPVAYAPHVMDHEIVCPKCGAVDRYEMTPQAYLALTVLPKGLDDMAALLTGKKSGADLPLNPRLHPFRSSVFGKPMHPLAGLEEYRRRIAANPRDAKLYMRMGTLLRTLYRYPEALEAHRQAYALNPNDAEIVLARAMSEHDFGGPAAAKEMYQRVLTLELEGKRTWGIFRSDTWASAAAEGLELLKQRKPSLWALPAYDPNTGQKTKASVSLPVSRSRKRKRRRRR